MIYEKAICRLKVDKDISFAATREEMERSKVFFKCFISD
jgi:hypothetical protein